MGLPCNFQQVYGCVIAVLCCFWRGVLAAGFMCVSECVELWRGVFFLCVQIVFELSMLFSELSVNAVMAGFFFVEIECCVCSRLMV